MKKDRKIVKVAAKEGVAALRWNNLEAPVDELRFIRATLIENDGFMFGGSFLRASLINRETKKEFEFAAFASGLSRVEAMFQKAVADAAAIATIMGFHS